MTALQSWWLPLVRNPAFTPNHSAHARFLAGPASLGVWELLAATKNDAREPPESCWQRGYKYVLVQEKGCRLRLAV